MRALGRGLEDLDIGSAGDEDTCGMDMGMMRTRT